MGIAKMALERVTQADRRGAGDIVDETYGFSAGFGGKAHRELQADFGLRREQCIAAFDIAEGEFRGAIERVARSLDSRGGLAEQKLRQLLLAQRCGVVGRGLRLAEIDRGLDRCGGDPDRNSCFAQDRGPRPHAEQWPLEARSRV